MSSLTTVRGTTRRPVWLDGLIWYIILLTIGTATVFPFLWLLLTSLKGDAQPVFANPPELIPTPPTIANYIRVWNQLPIWRFFVNSTIVALATVILNLLVTSLAAYPLAKMRFKGREFIFYLLLSTLVVPAELTYIPLYIMSVRFFQLEDTFIGLILPGISSAFNIFLLRQNIKSIPEDMLDSARIDGASEFRIWRSIVIPNIRPALASVSIFTMIASWNALLWPVLLLNSQERFTLPVGLLALRSQFSTDFRLVAAGAILGIIPILIFFFVLQRHFVQGLSGAVKG